MDEPVPSDEQIDRHRNFAQVLADHRNMTEPLYRRPLYRNPRAFIGLVLILVIGALVFQAVEEEKEATEMAGIMEQIEQARDQQFLQPAGIGFSIPAVVFDVDPGQEKQITLPSGVVVRVPENAFSEEGNPVQVSVREFNDPLIAILAGIPLDFPESGMAVPSKIFEISTTSNGQPISLGPDAKITIEMVGPRNPKTENEVLYVLDVKEKVWKNSRSEVNMEERPIDSPHSPVVIHDDGFNVVEYENDGSIRNRPVAPEEAAPGGEIQWVRSFESSGNGYFMCASPEQLTAPNQSIRLLDTAGKRIPVFALYQVSKDGKSARTYWPQDSKFTYEIATAMPGSKLFGFTDRDYLVWLETPGQNGEEVVELQPEISARPIMDLQTLKAVLAIESE